MIQERMDLHHLFFLILIFFFVLWILVFALCSIINLRLHLIAYRLLSLLVEEAVFVNLARTAPILLS